MAQILFINLSVGRSGSLSLFAEPWPWQPVSMLTLYLTPRSPFARRVRLALLRLDLPFSEKEENIFEPTEDFLRMAPLGMVPALGGAEGLSQPLYDSMTILEFLHESCGERIWPRELLARTRVRRVAALVHGVMTATVARHLEKMHTTPDHTWLADHEGVITRAIAELAHADWSGRELARSQAHWDLAVALQYLDLRFPEFEWKLKHPSLVQAYGVLMSEAAFLRTVPPEFKT